MIGVVLWCDPEDRKAVFWCEDQGDLAFYDAATYADAAAIYFTAGDMVQFEAVNGRTLRKARNPQMLQAEACRGLPDRLRQTTPDRAKATSARILPFVPPDPCHGSAAAQGKCKA